VLTPPDLSRFLVACGCAASMYAGGIVSVGLAVGLAVAFVAARGLLNTGAMPSS